MAGFSRNGDQRGSSAPAEYNLKQLLLDASTRWLKPAEICEILNNHHQLTLSEASPVKPSSGSLFLFDRNKLRYFRKDGHNWRKKRDGRTVREAHEKLKAGNKDAIHCYYAHGEDNPSFQRRSYWLLEGGYENIVLVHYREVTEGSRLEASPPTFEENFGQAYSQIQSPNMMYGNTNYLTSSFISSPSEVVSSSHNSQEGLLDVDSGDEFGENQRLRETISPESVLENSMGLDSSACTDYAPSSVAPGAFTMAHASRPIGSTLSNPVVNNISQCRHELQFQTATSRDPYGQGALNKDLEDSLAAIQWSNILESPFSAGDNSGGNWRGFQPSQQSAVVKNPDFAAGSYNDQLALRDSEVYLGQGVASNEAWSLDLENKSDAEYPTAVRQQSKPGEIQATNDGLLSPTVSLFMQSISTDLTIPTVGTSWGNISKIQYAVPNASSLPQQTRFHTAPEILLDIVDFAPEWSYAFGKTKVLVIGVFLDSTRNYSGARWSCKFGDVEVPADVLQPGILRCTTPPLEPGRFSFCVTCGDGVSCSNVKEFEFRVKSFVESSEKPLISDRKLETDKQVRQKEQAMLHQTRLAKYLLTTEDKASTQEQEQSSNTAPTQQRNEKLDLLLVDDISWSQIESLIRRDQHPYEDAKVMLGQTFFKYALHQWLQRKSNGESITALDEHGLGVLHMVAALGYEWAIPPLLAAGVGVNSRDERGWTALHWAAFCGREKVIALLLAAGASAGALTDPTPSDPTGRTASDLAASHGHDGIAAYLGEAIVTSHFTSLNLSEMSKLSVAVACDQAIGVMSERSTVVGANLGVDDLSLSLAAVRNASQAEACITATFRAYSFQRKKEKEESVLDEYGMLEEEARAFAAAQSTSRGYLPLEKSNLAATQIQCKYRGWKVRSDFLSLKKHVVRIQAHVRGHQARKKYKKILWTVSVLDKVILRWRRKGSGLRGYKADGIEDEDSDYDTCLKDFRDKKEAAFGEAVGRVKQMIQNPEARSQYRRMLEMYQKEKGAQLDEEDLVIFDDDELMGLLG
ncbi:hypothetical protein GOP47_0023712 [Adiantum capillus-veneris]|uniref:CG-1 domain-containing protein n=1 Tax=Adiantum capillus-veneris TaxID=13818 RepID=A0A9D4Z5E0_ADICA|nr:hypothetical protein GOP47_0023712 [Adiantum capillus-veneris]